MFNLLATNRDDHGRNHVFSYDERTRNWTLAPAFDLTPSVYNVLVGLSWLGNMTIPTTFTSLLRLAEIGGITPKVAREIYDQVEAATLGGWRQAARQAGVPEAMIIYWETEIIQQTQTLREDVHRAAKPSGRQNK